MIAEKDKVYEEYPITLISRLEKHFVLASLILEELHSQLSLLPHIALRPSLMEKNTQTPLSTTRNQATQMEKSILVTRKTQTVQTTVFTQATQTEESICDIKVYCNCTYTCMCYNGRIHVLLFSPLKRIYRVNLKLSHWSQRRKI